MEAQNIRYKENFRSGDNPINFFFLPGHFAINYFFLYATSTQAYQRKMEKFFVSEEKSFIGSATGDNCIKETH